MPASSVRLSALIWSILLSAVAGPASSASPYADSAAGRDQVRESRIRAALEPDRTYASQVRALERRRAPDSVNLFLVGCDFSDSLMYGRDPVDFPGWPPQRRQSQRIPGTGIPVFAATVISRLSFENRLERFLSCAPLRCMMFLNLE